MNVRHAALSTRRLSWSIELTIMTTRLYSAVYSNPGVVGGLLDQLLQRRHACFRSAIWQRIS